MGSPQTGCRINLFLLLLLLFPGSEGALPPWPSEVQEGVADQPSTSPRTELGGAKYGVDVSFPIHHSLDKRTFQGKRYDEFMQGCYARYGRPSCDGSERSRQRLNLRQPKTQQNYTETGFAKVRAPAGAFAPLQKFFRDHKEAMAPEQWPRGNTYTNHWAKNPTYMLSLEDNRFREGRRIKSQVWDAVREVLEEWTGERLKPTSLYGIRVYKEGAILASHVDRLPLVTSAIINVDQDLNSPWPVEVYDHAGHAHNVSMKPGDMVMYESHTCVHGRPSPLDGDYYANVFVHFIPVDSSGHEKNEGSSETMKYPPPHHDSVRGAGWEAGSTKTKLRASGVDEPEYYNHRDHEGWDKHDEGRHREGEEADNEGGVSEEEKGVGGGGGRPGETPEEREEREEQEAPFATGSTSLHMFAARGDVAAVEKEISRLQGLENGDGGGASIDSADANNWHPLHEAARGGHLEVVKKLVDAGADLGATTFQGGTPLWWARETHGEANEVVEFLRNIGAPDFSEGDEL
jgi:hypothetical protein